MKNHTKVKVDRKYPFPKERKASKAELAAMVQAEVPRPPREKKQKVEGGSSRLGCA